MLADIDKGLIDTVIIKDMSRLGRDYLKVDYVKENPQAHILVTLREIDEQGRWKQKSYKEKIVD